MLFSLISRPYKQKTTTKTTATTTNLRKTTIIHSYKDISVHFTLSDN